MTINDNSEGAEEKSQFKSEHSQHSDSDSGEFANDSKATSHGGKPKRIRINHNEIERKRRNAQKDRLDELRRSIPSLASQERASTVSIIVKAKEYIDILLARVAELESGVSLRTPYSSSVLKAHYTPPPSKAPVARSGINFAPIAPAPRLMAHHLQQYHSQIASQFPTNLTNSASLNQAMLLAEAASSLPTIISPIPLAPESPKREPEVKRNSSSGSDDFLSLLQHRKSSLILPTDNSIYFGKRDSIQNFLNSGLSSILEETVQSDIKCSKCSRGILNLIMIDCDNCHSWYHIRCLGMETSNIPLTWRCLECTTPNK